MAQGMMCIILLLIYQLKSLLEVGVILMKQCYNY